MKLIIFTDGASRGNPGPSSYGFTISDGQGKLIYEEGKYIGETTNNVAEYTAVLEAFKYIKSNKKQVTSDKNLQVELYADSKLVAEQLSGRYKIKSAHLKLLITQIQTLAMELGGVIYNHVPRSQNSIADRLANLALDNRK